MRAGVRAARARSAESAAREARLRARRLPEGDAAVPDPAAGHDRARALHRPRGLRRARRLPALLRQGNPM